MPPIKWQIERRCYDSNQSRGAPQAWRPVKWIEAPNLAVALVRAKAFIEASVESHQKDGEVRLVRQDHIAVVPWTAERDVSTRVRFGAVV
jgi:hypothetical protein